MTTFTTNCAIAPMAGRRALKYDPATRTFAYAIPLAALFTLRQRPRPMPQELAPFAGAEGDEAEAPQEFLPAGARAELRRALAFAGAL